MPLKVDSLVANSITSNVIIMEGSPIGGTNLFPGKINDTNVFTQVGTSEMKLDSLMVPANSIQGVLEGFPYFSVIVERNLPPKNGDETAKEKLGQLILKLYVSETDSIDGLTPFYQITSEQTIINPSGIMLPAYYDSGFPGYGSLVQYDKNKIKILYNNGYNSTLTATAQDGGDKPTMSGDNGSVIVIPGDGGGIPVIGGQSYTIQTFDNYDVSKNQYLIVTAQATEGQIEAKTLSMVVSLFGR